MNVEEAMEFLKTFPGFTKIKNIERCWPFLCGAGASGTSCQGARRRG